MLSAPLNRNPFMRMLSGGEPPANGLMVHASLIRARIPIVAGADRDVPPHTAHGDVRPPNEFRAPAPEAHAPTATMSGRPLPRALGPRSDHGWAAPDGGCGRGS